MDLSNPLNYNNVITLIINGKRKCCNFLTYNLFSKGYFTLSKFLLKRGLNHIIMKTTITITKQDKLSFFASDPFIYQDFKNKHKVACC